MRDASSFLFGHFIHIIYIYIDTPYNINLPGVMSLSGHFLHILCYAFKADNIFVPCAVLGPQYPADLLMQHYCTLFKNIDCLLETKLEPWLLMLIDKKDKMAVACNAMQFNAMHLRLIS